MPAVQPFARAPTAWVPPVLHCRGALQNVAQRALFSGVRVPSPREPSATTHANFDVALVTAAARLSAEGLLRSRLPASWMRAFD